MSSKILIKRSTTTGAIPTTADLDTGEFAVNTVDKRIFTNNQGTIVELGTNPTAVNTGSITTTSGTAGSWTVTGTLTVSAPSNATDAASKGYVDAQIASVIDSAPDALNTLNELAQALNDDANFANNVLLKAGGTMTGNLNMGSNKVTTTANPTADDDLARKGYVDTILGSATDAATSASEAATSATNAATSEANASTSASNAATSASNASTSATSASSSASSASTSATSASTSATQAQTSATQAATSASNAEDAWDSFDDRYLGSKASDPTVDNDGNTLLTGALYWNSTDDEMRVYTGSAWNRVYLNAGDALQGANNLSDVASATTSRNNLDAEQAWNYTNTATSKTLTVKEKCLVTAATQTITLPASPSEDDVVGIIVENFTDTVVARNGSTIMEVAEDLTIDKEYVSLDLVYQDGSWRMY